MKLDWWRPIPGYEGLYEASAAGFIRSLDRPVGRSIRRGRILVARPNGRWQYPEVTLCSTDGTKRTCKVASLVARAFYGIRVPGLIVLHNDGNRLNSHRSNLRYGTYQANENDKERHGRKIIAEKNNKTKLCRDDVDAIRRSLEVGEPVRVVASRYGVWPQAIKNIRDGKAWRHHKTKPDKFMTPAQEREDSSRAYDAALGELRRSVAA